MPSQPEQLRRLMDVSEQRDSTNDKRVFEEGASGGCEPQGKKEVEEVEEVDVEMEEEEEAPEPHQVQQYDHSPSRTIISFCLPIRGCHKYADFLLVNAHQD